MSGSGGFPSYTETQDAKLFNAFSSAKGYVSALPFLDAVVAERPDLADKPHVVPSTGKTGHAVLYQDEVFKGPKLERHIKAFSLECQVQKRLSDANVPFVPHVTLVSDQSHLLGQKRVAGAQLFEKGLSRNERKQLAQDIALFMHKMAQAVPLNIAQDWGYKSTKPDIERIQQALATPEAKEVLKGEYKAVQSAIDEYAKKAEGQPPIFFHSDMNATNILYDSAQKRLSGVIDYGMCELGLPATMFARLFNEYRSKFGSMVAQEYARISGTLEVTYADACLARLAKDAEELAYVVETNTTLNYGWIVRETLEKDIQQLRAAGWNAMPAEKQKPAKGHGLNGG